MKGYVNKVAGKVFNRVLRFDERTGAFYIVLNGVKRKVDRFKNGYRLSLKTVK